MSKRLAVLGSPIAHSKSPQIQLAALRILGIEATFNRIEVANLSEFLSSGDQGFDAFSLTMPLKEQARAVADWEDELVSKTNSANYLLRSGDQWKAFNTDVFGIKKAVEKVPAKTVGVLGTGATARSALAAFTQVELRIWGRNTDAAQQLAQDFDAASVGLDAVLDCDLVVSTLPGDALADLVARQHEGVLLDVVYSRPSPEGFTAYVSGLRMLIWQAIGQLRILLNDSNPLPDEEALANAMLIAAEVAE